MTHNVAYRVVSVHFSTGFVHFKSKLSGKLIYTHRVAAFNLEVFTNHFNTGEKAFKVRNFYLFETSKVNGTCRSVPHFCHFMNRIAFSDTSLNRLLVHSNYQIVHYHPCIVTMNVAFLGVRTKVVFQTITSVEELTNVSANILIERKLAAWMMNNELGDIKHHLIENDKLLS